MAKSIHFLKKDISTSQDLSEGALSYTTSFGRKFKLEQIYFEASQPITENLTVVAVMADGTEITLKSISLVAQSEYVYKPEGEANFQAGDEIKVTCTNANEIGTITAIFKTSEM